MFGKKRKNPKTSDEVTIIAKGTRLEGTFTMSGNLRVDGEFHGFLIVEGKAIIGKTGKVTGYIDADELLVEGFVKGELIIRHLLTIVAGGISQGRFFLNNLHMEPEGILYGQCFMGPEIREKLQQYQRIKVPEQIQLPLPSYDSFVEPLLQSFSISNEVPT